MRRFALLGIVLLATPSLALAHVSVRPRVSKAGAEERYTVRVPTEGTVATTHVQLEIPAGLTVLEVLSRRRDIRDHEAGRSDYGDNLEKGDSAEEFGRIRVSSAQSCVRRSCLEGPSAFF